MQQSRWIPALLLAASAACSDESGDVAVAEAALEPGIEECDDECDLGAAERAVIDDECDALDGELPPCADAEERMARRQGALDAIRDSLADRHGHVDCVGARALVVARDRILGTPGAQADMAALTQSVVQGAGRWVPTATDIAIQAELRAAYAARAGDPTMRPMREDPREHWVEQVPDYADQVLPQEANSTLCDGPYPQYTGDPEARCYE